jgi:hypothetical protein
VRREDPAPEEKIFIDELNHYLKEETGYQWIQGEATRAQPLPASLPAATKPGR